MRNGTTIYGTSTVTRAAVGDGGYMTGGDAAGDGTFVGRTDTNGAYLWNPGGRAWTPLIQMGVNLTEANGKYNYPKGSGAYDAAISYTNSSCIAVCTMGYVYYSSNKGSTWTKTTLAYNAALDPNGSDRLYRKRLAIDPSAAGTGVLYFFDPTVTTGGLYYSLNSGTTWTKSASVPAATSATSGCIAIDRNATVVSGKTQTVVVYSPGNGIYKSTTGVDGTFSAIAGGPTSGVTSLTVYSGNVCFADGTQIKRWNGTTWSQVSTQAVFTLALNPLTPAQIVAFDAGGKYIASTDSGATWTTLPGTGLGRTAVDVPWLATTREDYMSAGMAWFDPANAGDLILAEGIGPWRAASASLAQGAAPTWVSFARGIDQLVSMMVTVTPTGRVLYAVQDRQFLCFDKNKLTVYPKNIGYHYGPPNTLSTVAINHGTGIDWAADNELYVVGVSWPWDSGTDWRMGISTDGGKTWAAPAAFPANCTGGIGAGAVAVGNTGNIVWVPSNGSSDTAYPSYTTDGGATWTQCKFAGVNLSGLAFPVVLHGAYYNRRICVAADKTVPLVFYCVIYGTDSDATTDAAYRGLWKSTDGGANFTRVYNARINGNGTNYDGFHGKLKMVHGYTGHMIWCSGDVGVDDTAINLGLRWSGDGGVTFTTIPGLYEPEDFCIGAPAPGSSYPTIEAYGYSAVSDNTTRGRFRCTNFNPANVAAATWTLIGNSFPGGDYSSNAVMGAHPSDTFGRSYLGKQGLFICDYQDMAGVT